MIAITENLARQYSCPLAPRKVPGWRRYFCKVFSGFPFINIQKLEDKEKGVEKQDRGAEGEMGEKEARRGKNKRRTKGDEMYMYNKQTES
jgi:hypothetical protein